MTNILYSLICERTNKSHNIWAELRVICEIAVEWETVELLCSVAEDQLACDVAVCLACADSNIMSLPSGSKSPTHCATF